VVTELRDANPTRLVIDRIDVTQRVYCDPPRIEQLLSNLLGNALTHGTPDFPTEVAAALDIDDLVLSVRNGGEPISPETLPKVFEPYWRPAHSERGGGLGLGLYICKQIVSAHGGTLEVESTRASGTVFTARIPMRDSPERIAH
jgi:signal transduction histidine kinase